MNKCHKLRKRIKNFSKNTWSLRLCTFAKKYTTQQYGTIVIIVINLFTKYLYGGDKVNFVTIEWWKITLVLVGFLVIATALRKRLAISPSRGSSNICSCSSNFDLESSIVNFSRFPLSLFKRWGFRERVLALFMANWKNNRKTRSKMLQQ